MVANGPITTTNAHISQKVKRVITSNKSKIYETKRSRAHVGNFEYWILSEWLNNIASVLIIIKTPARHSNK